MRMMGEIFVMGRTNDETLKRMKKPEHQGFTASFDMLGEAAQRQRYEEAVDEQPLLVHPREVSGIEIPREAGPEIAAGILLNPSADEVRPDRQAIVMQVAQHPIELRVPVIQ